MPCGLSNPASISFFSTPSSQPCCEQGQEYDCYLLSCFLVSFVGKRSVCSPSTGNTASCIARAKGLPSADTARAGCFRAVFAVMAVFARITGVASCAGAAFMNAHRVSAHFACRCLRCACKSDDGYYGGDKRYRFHESRLDSCVTRAASSKPNHDCVAFTNLRGTGRLLLASLRLWWLVLSLFVFCLVGVISLIIGAGRTGPPTG